MKHRSLCLSFLALALVGAGCQTTRAPQPQAEAPAEPAEAYLFGWGSLPRDVAKPRGGSTRGAPVELAPARALPLASIAAASDAFARDRAAILSLAGDYKASFHFLETVGLGPEDAPRAPYHSWATERVEVVEDSGAFISLQHILAMYFVGEDGEVSEPMVMKHWRQDWSYEDTDLRVFRGGKTWERETRAPESVEGAWTQRVWQVDDSPRYEAVGRWTHEGNRSAWTGETTWRPLPRREFSSRDDYDVMEGFHRILITPQGWLHEQNNWKRVAGEGAAPAYRGHEIGIDRYELIAAPSLAAAEEYWKASGPYWAQVREAWEEVFAQRDRVVLLGKVDGKSQFEHHFEYAQRLADGAPFDEAEARAFARETVARYLAEE